MLDKSFLYFNRPALPMGGNLLAGSMFRSSPLR
jgi:hypothetical protein